MTAEQPKMLSLTLASGEELRAIGIMLYSADDVSAVVNLRAKANKLLGGVSTGIGFWGSPEWAIGGALMMRAVEGFLSQQSAKEGFAVLSQVQERERELKRNGVFVSVEKIVNVNNPSPREWHALTERDRVISLRDRTPSERYALVKKFNIQNSDVRDDDTVVVRDADTLVFDGDAFLTLELEGSGTVHVRWESVTRYRVEG